ncbi:MAG: L-serine ammonia-lyase [Bacteroidota bacterium]
MEKTVNQPKESTPKEQGSVDMMNPIKTSVFDLYKVGPGPSSSHTIGPMKAAYDFLQRIQDLPKEQRDQANTIRITLFGSLSATGSGHGTDRAIIAGLLGWKPAECDPEKFSALDTSDDASYELTISDDHQIAFKGQDIVFGPIAHDYPFSNTLIMELRAGSELLFDMEYYSVGGGFIQWKGRKEPEVETPPFPYKSMDELKALLKKHDIPLHTLMLENEKVISGLSEQEIYDRMDAIINTMCAAVERGISTTGVLPGSIELQRKSPKVYERAKGQTKRHDRFLVFLNAYCLAASEENAAGHLHVTAPTSGASGVIPGVLYLMKKHYKNSMSDLRKGMLAAAAIGFLVKHNASISGAEMGCMGEVGTASAMGAAMISYLNDCDIRCLEVAAEIAIEHHLGMTCDPVGGYVQIPCIERNAVGGVKAYNAYLLASSGIPDSQKVTLDKVIDVMRETGRDMSKKYKETSQGGLALSMTEC